MTNRGDHAFCRAAIRTVFRVVTGSVESFGSALPAGKTHHSGLHSPNRFTYYAACT